MSNFKLEFETDNEAFSDSKEIDRILRTVADRVSLYWKKGTIRDINGNKVGYWTMET